MKKVFAMAMLALLLFNLGGYSLLFQYFIYRSDASIIENINNNHYSEKDLIEVKIPGHLAMDEDWKDFALISGTVHFKDKSYNYAELKMTRDTMYLLCIPNNDKTRLINANVIYAKNVSDIQSNKKSHTPLVKKVLSENIYNYTTISYNAFVRPANTKARHDYTFSATVKTAIGIQGQPPEAQASLS